MPDLNGRELLSEWRQVMESVLSSAASAASRTELPGDLVRASQRQLELLAQLVEREQRLQGGLLDGLLAPVDAVFDLLAESGATLRRQAETLETAGRALQDTAVLMKQQAELFERTIAMMRRPTSAARSAARGGRSPAPAQGAAKPGRQRTAKAPAKPARATRSSAGSPGKAAAKQRPSPRKR
jgi:hypothetical protein